MRKCIFNKLTAAALALAVCLVSGCGAQSSTADGSPAPTAEEYETPAYAPEAAVTALECLHPDSGAYIAEVDATHMAVSWIDYDEGVTHVAVVDIAGDTVVSETGLDGLYYMDERLYDGGRLVVRDPDMTDITVLDGSLARVEGFSVPCCGGELSGDCSAYYYADRGSLMRCDTASGSVSVVPTELTVSAIYDIDPVSGLLSVAFNVDVYGTNTCTGVIDPVTGDLAALRALSGILELCGDKWFYTYYDSETYAQMAVYGSGENARRISSGLSSGADCALTWVPGSDCAFCIQTVYSEEGYGSETGYWFYDLGADAVRGADLAQYGISGVAFGSAWLDGSGLAAASIYDADASAYTLYVIDPSRLDYGASAETETVSGLTAVDETIISGYEQELAGIPIAPELADIRARADGMEEQYGITILISDECRVACRYGDFEELLTSEDAGINEVTDLTVALDRIEEALALYPDGFFSQFRSADGRGGICLMLVGSIESTYSVAGFQFDSGVWKCIELDVNHCGSFVSMLCHEFMHAIENKIVSDAPEADLYNAWIDCNPAGVEYYCSYTSGILDYSHTYSEGGARGDDIYFCDGYSKTFPTEDRARLMEYVMAYPYIADELMESSVMYAKYEVLCRSIRMAFDTDGWTDVWWERYLKA